MSKPSSFEQGALYVAKGAQKGFARFAVTLPPPGQPHVASLIAGQITTNGAYVVSMDLSLEQLKILRDECDAALSHTLNGVPHARA